MDSEIVVDAGNSKESDEIRVPEPDYGNTGEDAPGNIPSLSSDEVEEDAVQPKMGEVIGTQDLTDTSTELADGEQEIPAPDYPDEEEQVEGDQDHKTGLKVATQIISVVPSVDSCLASSGDDGALIAPKKLINPCLLSKEHKALRQELKINQKLGKNPTEKPELIKVLRERQEKEKKKEMEQHMKSKRTSLDIRLEEQAQKISQAEQVLHQESEQKKSEEEKPEFFKIHSRINKTKLDS